MPTRILISPNAFKHSLSAEAAAYAIETGLKRSRLVCSCECFPVADGGDGTAYLIIKKCGGAWIEGMVPDPLGKTIKASFGWIAAEKMAVIEMADASGIRLLQPADLNPLRASSCGTGMQIKMALDRGARRIIVAMGGSATVDGGAGILHALGARFLDQKGRELAPFPESLLTLDHVDLSGIDTRLAAAELTVLCDVDNRLLGAQGAAAVFGPQKGATADVIEKLEACLSGLAEVALQQTGKNMSDIQFGGTAGGAAAGLYAFLHARLVQGIDHFLDLTEFESSLEKADLLITGEGSIDRQTLQGKAPVGVAARAKARHIPVIALAGQLPVENDESLRQFFDVMMAIGNGPAGLSIAFEHTAANLSRTSTEIGNLLALANNNLLPQINPDL